MADISRAVVTIATGKKLYMDMAATLARSYHHWNRGIPFILLTDHASTVPADIEGLEGVQVVRKALESMGRGFSIKLFLDQLSPAAETLFIDADCLVTGPVEPVFERFRGQSVSTVGALQSEGEWFGDIDARCRQFDVESVPVFVGSVYYLKDDAISRQVFNQARALVPDYDELGFVRLRDVPNEEPLLSVGMALNGQEPLADDGLLKADAMNFENSIAVDIFSGTASFDGTGSKKTSWGVTHATPVIAHFNDTYTERPPYTREQSKLKRVYQDGWGKRTAAVYAWGRHQLPHAIISRVKDLGRPMYRALFGAREVQKNPRLLD